MSQANLEDFLGDRSAALPRTTTLFRESGLRTLLLHLKAGEHIPEHQMRGAIMVHCVAGRGIFVIGADAVELRPGVLVSVPPASPHSVNAGENEDLVLLVAMSEQVAAER